MNGAGDLHDSGVETIPKKHDAGDRKRSEGGEAQALS